MKRGDNYIVGVDLETGGFEPGVHSILAIGGYWRETEVYQGSAGASPHREHRLRVLCEREPQCLVETEAAKKNGWVSDEQWLDMGAVPLRDGLQIFTMWITRLAEVTLEGAARLKGRLEPLAHNHAAVDRPFLEYWLARFDLKEAVFGESGLLSHAWHDSMTTLRAAQVAGLVPAEGGASLDAMIKHMGRPRRGMKRPEGANSQGPKGEGANPSFGSSGIGASGLIHDAGEDAQLCFDGYHWLTELMKRGRQC